MTSMAFQLCFQLTMDSRLLAFEVAGEGEILFQLVFHVNKLDVELKIIIRKIEISFVICLFYHAHTM